MNRIMFQSVIWTPTHCCILNIGILGIYTTKFLLTNQLIQSDDLSKICSSIVLSLPLTFLVINHMIVGNSTTLNQLEAESIMVRAMKSIDEPSLPLSVYRPTRLTHKVSHGVLITILDGRCPYFCVHFLFTWQVLHDFAMDWMVFLIPFQYIAFEWRGGNSRLGVL